MIKKFLKRALLPLALAASVFAPATALATANGFEITTPVAGYHTWVMTQWYVGNPNPVNGQTANRWLQGNVRGTHSTSNYHWHIDLINTSGQVTWTSPERYCNNTQAVPDTCATFYRLPNTVLPADGTRAWMRFWVYNTSWNGSNDVYYNEYIYCVTGTVC